MVHEVGLVTEWASRDCVGDRVVVTEPKGSFDLPADAEWLMLVGDLTAMPAMARIAESTDLPTRVWAEVSDDLARLPARARGRDLGRRTSDCRRRHRPRLARDARLLLDGR